MPNLAPIVSVPFEAGPFVTTKYDVALSNGMLTSFTADRPSEIDGFVSIPADLIKTYISTVTEIFKFKIDYASDKADMAKKQAEYIDTLNALLQKLTLPTTGTGTPVTSASDK
jgi:hypothetical protein